ncbi:MAG: DedA family protein [Planctomycetota bacterium]|jgi:membrane protein DedA with SNARE-associated domain|nr:DedA family protein [Planctomycetota bacterium]
MLEAAREYFAVFTNLLVNWSGVVCQWLADTLLALGYPGIVILMGIESSFIPVPSEIVMPPAGYLISEGKMGWLAVLASGTLGCLIGSWFNYFLALWLGRPFFLRYGGYFGVNLAKIERAEAFFARHGEAAIFIARLIPVVRQLISLPAGAARMNLGKFTLYTFLGAGIWTAVLTWIGWEAGQNREILFSLLRQAGGWVFVFAFLFALLYWVFLGRRRRDGLTGVASPAGPEALARTAKPQASELPPTPDSNLSS